MRGTSGRPFIWRNTEKLCEVYICGPFEDYVVLKERSSYAAVVAPAQF